MNKSGAVGIKAGGSFFMGGSMITIVISSISCVVALAALWRNFHADTKHDAGQLMEIIVKLETINENVKEVKSDMKDVKSDMDRVKERLIIAEESAKAAHRRIDILEHLSKKEDKA